MEEELHSIASTMVKKGLLSIALRTSPVRISGQLCIMMDAIADEETSTNPLTATCEETSRELVLFARNMLSVGLIQTESKFLCIDRRETPLSAASAHLWSSMDFLSCNNLCGVFFSSRAIRHHVNFLGIQLPGR